MIPEPCAHCGMPSDARKVIRGGFTIPICEHCLAEDRAEHDDTTDTSAAADTEEAEQC